MGEGAFSAGISLPGSAMEVELCGRAVTNGAGRERKPGACKCFPSHQKLDSVQGEGWHFEQEGP